MDIEFFVFSVEAFRFSKFQENESKHDKRNIKRGLTMTFEVKNLQSYRKSQLEVLQTYYFRA